MMTRSSLVHRGAYLGLGLVVGLLLAGRSTSPAAIAGSLRDICQKATPTPTITNNKPTRRPSITVKLSDHPWRLTLTGVSVRTAIHSDYGSVKAKGKFVIVYLTAQNLDKKPHELAFDEETSLVDSQGRSFSRNVDASSDAASAANIDNYEDVQPTFTTHVAFTYDVAADAHGFVLQNGGQFGDKPIKLFDLSVTKIRGKSRGR